MKPPLPRTLSAVPLLPHVRFEIAKAVRTLMLQENPRLAKAAADDPEHPGWHIGRKGRSV